MRGYLLIACVVATFGACKKDKWEQSVSDLAGFRDKMCACKTISGDRAIREDCAARVEDDVKEWEKGMKAKVGKDEKPPEKLIELGDKVEHELLDCRKEIQKDFAAMKAEQAGGGAATAPTGSATTP